MKTSASVSTEFPLNGLVGNNPLAFLAALGTLHASTYGWPQCTSRLHWIAINGALRPVLTTSRQAHQGDLLDLLLERLHTLADNPAISFAEDLSVSDRVLRLAATQSAASATFANRSAVDLIAAFGCESIVDQKTGNIADTALRTMSGAGHQHFLGFMRQLLSSTSRDDLEASLFNDWNYSNPGPSLRWDPVDDRRYALRWSEPSGDPIRTMRGANALAVNALALLPTQPTRSGLQTTGFETVPRKGTFWTWPIWSTPITLDVARSLLALTELQEGKPCRRQLSPLGIIEIFRTQRITQGKYRNFTVAAPV